MGIIRALEAKMALLDQVELWRKVCDMHLSGNTLFYTDHEDKLFYFVKLSIAGKFVAKLKLL